MVAFISAAQPLLLQLALAPIDPPTLPVAQNMPPIELVVPADDECRTSFEGRAIAYPDLKESAAAWVRDGRTRARLLADRNASYRCIGGAIFTLQMVGFKDIVVLVDGLEVMIPENGQ